jgi:hypothetical protein
VGVRAELVLQPGRKVPGDLEVTTMKIKKHARDIVWMLSFSTVLYVAGSWFMLHHQQWFPGSAMVFGLAVNGFEFFRNRKLWFE